MQAQGVSGRPVRAGPSPAGKFSLYNNHRPQRSAVKPVPALYSGVKSKKNQSYLQFCMLAGWEARKIHTLKLQFASFSSVFYLPAVTTCKTAPRIHLSPGKGRATVYIRWTGLNMPLCECLPSKGKLTTCCGTLGKCMPSSRPHRCGAIVCIQGLKVKVM